MVKIDFKTFPDRKEEEKMFKAGYTYSLTQLKEDLNVSRSWIIEKLLNADNGPAYVVYDYVFAYEKFKSACQTYVKKEEIVRWFEKNAIFETQTDIVDLAAYISKYPSVLKKAIKEFEDYRTKLNVRNEKYVIGFLPKKVLNIINDNLVIHGAERQYSSRRRKEIPWKRIEAVDILNAKKRLYRMSKKPGIGELNYREAFERGDIKVTVGGLVFYIKNGRKYNKYKLPYLIPFDAKIRCLGVKKKPD